MGCGKAFLNLFNETISFEEYIKKFQTIQDISSGLRPGIQRSIIFAEEDNPDLE